MYVFPKGVCIVRLSVFCVRTILCFEIMDPHSLFAKRCSLSTYTADNNGDRVSYDTCINRRNAAIGELLQNLDFHLELS